MNVTDRRWATAVPGLVVMGVVFVYVILTGLNELETPNVGELCELSDKWSQVLEQRVDKPCAGGKLDSLSAPDYRDSSLSLEHRVPCDAVIDVTLSRANACLYG